MGGAEVGSENGLAKFFFDGGAKQTYSKRYDFFDRFRALRSIEASASVDPACKKRRSILFEKCTARQQQKLLGPHKPR